MKLSVNAIYFALKEVFPQTSLVKRTKQDNDLSLACPYFHKGTVTLRPSQIYVVTQEQLDGGYNLDGHCLVILPELTGKPSLRKNLSVITVSGADVIDLYNHVLAVFDQYTRWDDMLQDLVFHNAPIEEYLTCSLPFIGNAMTVHNNNFAYLARCGEDPILDRYSSNYKRDFIDPDFLLKVDMQSDQSVFYSKDVIHYQEELGYQEYFFLNLFNGNTAAGRLVVLSNRRPFAPHDDALVRHLGRYLEAALTYAAFSGSSKNLRRDSLLELLSGKQHSEDKILHLKTISPLSKLKEDQNLYCLTGMCQNTDVTEQYISYQIERFLPESVSVMYDSRIVVLCANRHKQSKEDFFEEVQSILEKYSVIAGCSNPFEDFYDLRYCYPQADFALQLNANRSTNEHLFRFKDHALEHFLQFGCSVLPVRLICADCIIKLAEHDEGSSVSYCDSLQEYLNTGMNAAETARRLNIQRNTFLARLERILRYVDLNLDNEDNRLYLQLSLRLIRKTRPRKV